MDFADLGVTYTADMLVGLGFKMCSNHYSIVFVEEAFSETTP